MRELSLDGNVLSSFTRPIPPGFSAGGFVDGLEYVNNPIDELNDLIALVNSFKLNPLLQLTLDTLLQKTEAAILAGKPGAACLGLSTFITLTRVVSGHGLTVDQAAQLLGLANRINAVLGCPPCS